MVLEMQNFARHDELPQISPQCGHSSYVSFLCPACHDSVTSPQLSSRKALTQQPTATHGLYLGSSGGTRSSLTVRRRSRNHPKLVAAVTHSKQPIASAKAVAGPISVVRRQQQLQTDAFLAAAAAVIHSNPAQPSRSRLWRKPCRMAGGIDPPDLPPAFSFQFQARSRSIVCGDRASGGGVERRGSILGPISEQEN